MVLNEAIVEYANHLDVNGGFDPARQYTPKELEQLEGKWLCGPEAFKRTGQDGKYLLLEVRLTDGTQSFSQLYLRGFDYIMKVHSGVAELFLDKDLRPTIGEHFELPDGWPRAGSGLHDKKPRTVEVEKN